MKKALLLITLVLLVCAWSKWPPGNSNICTSVGISLGPPLGPELWDAAASTCESGIYHWLAAGTNTVENEDKSIKITYIDNANGGFCYFRNTADLITDLTVGAKYIFQCRIKTNAGSTVTLRVNDGTDFQDVTVTETTFVDKTIIFTATSATIGFVRVAGMGAGEIAWLDNFSLRQLAPAP